MHDDNTNNKMSNILDENFEVTYNGEYNTELHPKQIDAKTDAYKDVLSALSELDDSQSFDYLEANKTKTIDLEQYLKDNPIPSETSGHNSLWNKVLTSCKNIFHIQDHQKEQRKEK